MTGRVPRGKLATPVGEDPSGNLFGMAMDAAGNILVNVNGGTIVIPHALLDGTQDNDTVAGAPARGDLITGILQGSGLVAWQKFALGAALQVLRVNAAGNGLEYGTVTGGYTEGARCQNSAVQSIPNSADTPLTFDTEIYDTDAIHDLITNPDRFTCKTAGKYICTFCASIQGNATGIRQFRIWKNGSPIAANQITVNTAGNSAVCNCTTVIDLAINDYIQFIINQNSGGALNSNATAGVYPTAEIQRIG